MTLGRARSGGSRSWFALNLNKVMSALPERGQYRLVLRFANGLRMSIYCESKFSFKSFLDDAEVKLYRHSFGRLSVNKVMHP